MNKRQVIILWVIAIVLGITVAIVKLTQNDATRSAMKRQQGESLFVDFPAKETAKISIQGAGTSVNLTQTDAGKWVVQERAQYPANAIYINEFLRTLAELKITQGMEAGPSFAPRFGMDESSSDMKSRGLTATFQNKEGKEIAKISLGKNIESSGEASPMGNSSVGRYIRDHADDSGFYAVSEMFPSVSSEPKRWLDDAFISPEKIRSISVTEPAKPGNSWTLTRETEEASYKLDGASATEVVDTTVTDPLKSVLSYARFDDIVPADQVAARTVPDQKWTVTIETFEGFKYTIGASPAKPTALPATPEPSEEIPTPSDNYLMTVDVSATLPTERKKEENEKPEDAKTKDTAFTDRSKALTEKLAKEKFFAGTVFEVAKSVLEPLLKDRNSVLTKVPIPEAEPTDTGSVQSLPGGMIARPPTATTPPIEAVTPPISVPAIEESAPEADAPEAPAAENESE